MPFTISASDKLLLGRTFQIQDPRGLPGLVAHVPPRAAIMEFEYDVGPPAPRNGPPDRTRMLPCAHCGPAPNHYRGFVMKTEEGERFLTGIVCGSKIYHLEFDNIMKEFQSLKVRQSELNRLVRVL